MSSLADCATFGVKCCLSLGFRPVNGRALVEAGRLVATFSRFLTVLGEPGSLCGVEVGPSPPIAFRDVRGYSSVG